MGPPGGTRPKNQDGGVRVSILQAKDNNLSVNPAFPVDVTHNSFLHHARPFSTVGTNQATS